jgi:NitT/TauT family transport system substrate-binding protein
MRSTTRAAAVVAMAIAVAAALASAAATSPKRTQLDEVKYATSFGSFGRDAFVYVAIEKGYFEEQNLSVSVVPGLGTDNARLLAAGQIDYSGSEITGNIIGRIVGSFPVKVVAVTSQSTQAPSRRWSRRASRRRRPSRARRSPISRPPS